MSEATPPTRLALSRLAAFIGISPDHGPVLIVDAAIRSIESLREKNGRLREEVRDLTSEVLRLSPEIEPETGESRAMDYCDTCDREIPEDGRTFPSDRGEVCEECYRVEDLKIRLTLGELVERLSKKRAKR